MFYNPETKSHETFALKDDARARARQKIKAKGQLTRRSVRHQLGLEYPAQMDRLAAAADGRRARAAAAGRRAPVAPRDVEMIDQVKDR